MTLEIVYTSGSYISDHTLRADIKTLLTGDINALDVYIYHAQKHIDMYLYYVGPPVADGQTYLLPTIDVPINDDIQYVTMCIAIDLYDLRESGQDKKTNISKESMPGYSIDYTQNKQAYDIDVSYKKILDKYKNVFYKTAL